MSILQVPARSLIHKMDTKGPCRANSIKKPFHCILTIEEKLIWTRILQSSKIWSLSWSAFNNSVVNYKNASVFGQLYMYFWSKFWHKIFFKYTSNCLNISVMRRKMAIFLWYAIFLLVCNIFNCRVKNCGLLYPRIPLVSIPLVLSIPWLHVYSMIPCLYHKSMSIP